MPVLPSEIPTGLVTGQFYFVSTDTADEDTDPQLEVVDGFVRFTSTAKVLRVPTKRATLIPLTFEAKFNTTGELVAADDPSIGLKLPQTDSELLNPRDYRWLVEFFLRRASDGHTVQIPSFYIKVPAEGTDLTDAMPVQVSDGVQIIQGPRGEKGDASTVEGPHGPANSLRIGTVTTADSAAATLTGDAPEQVLNLTLPKGDPGPEGPPSKVPGPVSSLIIGTVAKGEAAEASITGTAPNQKLNLVLPKGDTGPEGPPSSGTDPNNVGYDIFLLAGQSNISGSGGTPDSVLDAGNNSRVFTLPGKGAQVNRIIPASEPLASQPSDMSIGVGPGLAFAREYLNHVSPNRKVLLVPTAVGGSALVGGPWSVGGGYYKAALEQARTAVAHAGVNSRFAGIIWVQGEGDAVASRTETAYTDAWLAMMNGFRANIPGAANCRIVVGGMVPEWRQSTLSGTAAAIHAAHTKLPAALPNTFFVDGPAGFGYEQAPGIHYNAAGLRIFGQRMAKAMVAEAAVPRKVDTVSTTSWTPGEVTLTWPRREQSFPAISGYSVQYKASADTDWSTVISAATTDRPTAKVTGLAPGSLYDFRVAALNAIGAGTYSDTVPYTPPIASPLFGAAARFDARSVVGAVHGTTLASWADESGNGHTLNASDVAKRPVWALDGLNCVPAVVFKGAEYLMTAPKQITSFADAGQFTLFVVATSTGQPSGLTGMRTGGAFNIFSLSFDNSEYAMFEAFDGTYTNSSSRQPAAQNVSHILSAVRGATSKIRVDGTGAIGGTTAPYTGTTAVELSLGAITNGGFNAHRGAIAFMAIYKGVMSDTNIQKVENALRADFRLHL